MNRRLGAAIVLALAMGSTAAFGAPLPKMADKALYCAHVYLEAARAISADGDPGAARVIRAYGKEWMSFAYGYAVGFSRREVNALKPGYEVEARKDVAAKRYRFKDCGTYNNAN